MKLDPFLTNMPGYIPNEKRSKCQVIKSQRTTIITTKITQANPSITWKGRKPSKIHNPKSVRYKHLV